MKSLMPDAAFKIRRDVSALKRRLRELKLILKGALSSRHPVMAHIIPIRRCNLTCAYCNEYDDHSKPISKEVMFRRLDRLAELRELLEGFWGERLGALHAALAGGGEPFSSAMSDVEQ